MLSDQSSKNSISQRNSRVKDGFGRDPAERRGFLFFNEISSVAGYVHSVGNIFLLTKNGYLKWSIKLKLAVDNKKRRTMVLL